MNHHSPSYRGSLRLRVFRLAIAMLACHTAAAGVPAPAAAASADLTTIDRYVETHMRALRLPGIAVGIVQGERVIHIRGLGAADPTGRPVTGQTPFILGSTTKSFTALAVMQLAETGTIDLEAPAQRYIPWFRVADPSLSSMITVRHLLHQTSGLSELAGREHWADGDLSDTAIERGVRGLATVRLSRRPGAAWEYSNANYWTLGMIVQQVSGQSYESYMREHILAPLRMRQSFTSQDDARTHGMAVGHRYWFGRPVAAELPYNRVTLPSGYLISSAEDLTHYLIAQVNGGTYAGTPVVSPAGVAEMHRPAVRQGDGATSYAMGWRVGSIGTIQTVWHDGSTPNFHSGFMLAPGPGWGVAVLANAEGLSQDERITGIARGVMALLTGQDPPTADSFPQILYTAVLALAGLQMLWALAWTRGVRRRRAGAEQRSRGPRRFIWPLVASWVGHLSVAALFLIVVPRLFRAPLAGLLYVFPDFGSTLLFGGVLAIGWGIVRTIAIISGIRRNVTRS